VRASVWIGLFYFLLITFLAVPRQSVSLWLECNSFFFPILAVFRSV
jgi:hypothetical protein